MLKSMPVGRRRTQTKAKQQGPARVSGMRRASLYESASSKIGHEVVADQRTLPPQWPTPMWKTYP